MIADVRHIIDLLLGREHITPSTQGPDAFCGSYTWATGRATATSNSRRVGEHNAEHRAGHHTRSSVNTCTSRGARSHARSTSRYLLRCMTREYAMSVTTLAPRASRPARAH